MFCPLYFHFVLYVIVVPSLKPHIGWLEPHIPRLRPKKIDWLVKLKLAILLVVSSVEVKVLVTFAGGLLTFIVKL